MRMKRLMPYLPIAVALAASPVHAQVVIEGQNRRVDAHVEVWRHDLWLDEYVLDYEDDASASAPDAGPFERSLTAEYFESHGHASQFSTVAPDRLRATGGVSVYSGTDVHTSAGMGRSLYEVTFRAEEPQQYLLTYDRASQKAHGDRMWWDLRLVRLDDEDPTVVEIPPFLRDPFDDPLPDPVTGVLPPGRYRFSFMAGQESDHGSEWDYVVQLDLAAVPEPSSAASAVAAAGLIVLRRRHRRS